jgi:hypothetical protein
MVIYPIKKIGILVDMYVMRGSISAERKKIKEITNHTNFLQLEAVQNM